MPDLTRAAASLFLLVSGICLVLVTLCEFVSKIRGDCEHHQSRSPFRSLNQFAALLLWRRREIADGNRALGRPGCRPGLRRVGLTEGKP
jgi:hypothetical protein